MRPAHHSKNKGCKPPGIISNLYQVLREGGFCDITYWPEGKGGGIALRSLVQIDGDVVLHLSDIHMELEIWLEHRGKLEKRIKKLRQIRAMLRLIKWIGVPLLIAFQIVQNDSIVDALKPSITQLPALIAIAFIGFVLKWMLMKFGRRRAP